MDSRIPRKNPHSHQTLPCWRAKSCLNDFKWVISHSYVIVPEGTALICFGDKTWITHANPQIPQLYTPRICILFPIDVFFGARICGHSPIPDGPKDRTWFSTCHGFYLHNPYSPVIKDVKVESPINGHLNGQFPKSDDTTNGGGRVRRKLAGPLGWRRDQEEKKLRKKRRSEGWDTLTLNLLIEIGRIAIIISHLQNCRFQIFLRVLWGSM